MQTATVNGESVHSASSFKEAMAGNRDEQAAASGGRRFGDRVSPQINPENERRIQKRFPIDKHAFALIRSTRTEPIRIEKMSMGEIASAIFRFRPVILGRILNLSLNGLVFHYVDNFEVQPDEPLVLDILIADCGIYLKNLGFRMVTDCESGPDFSLDPVKMRQLSVQFENLTRKQSFKLEYIIRKCSAGDA